MIALLLMLTLMAAACDRKCPPPPEPAKTTTGTTTTRDLPGETTTTGADVPSTPTAEPTASDFNGKRDAGVYLKPLR